MIAIRIKNYRKVYNTGFKIVVTKLWRKYSRRLPMKILVLLNCIRTLKERD